MVKTQKRSQDKLLGYLASLALEQRRSVLLFPSVAHLKDCTGQDFYTVKGALSWLEATKRIAVERNEDGSFWIDLAPE